MDATDETPYNHDATQTAPHAAQTSPQHSHHIRSRTVHAVSAAELRELQHESSAFIKKVPNDTGVRTTRNPQHTSPTSAAHPPYPSAIQYTRPTTTITRYRSCPILPPPTRSKERLNLPFPNRRRFYGGRTTNSIQPLVPILGTLGGLSLHRAIRRRAKRQYHRISHHVFAEERWDCESPHSSLGP